MTPSTQRSGKRHLDAISTLTRRTGCLLFALMALTKGLFEKPELRGKSICTLINKAGYGLGKFLFELCNIIIKPAIF